MLSLTQYQSFMDEHKSKHHSRVGFVITSTMHIGSILTPKEHRLTAPSTGHYCNEGRISRSIGTYSVSSIGKKLALYELHLFGQICAPQIAAEIGRTAYAVHEVVSHNESLFLIG